MAANVLQWQNWVMVINRHMAPKSEIFIICLFKKNVLPISVLDLKLAWLQDFKTMRLHKMTAPRDHRALRLLAFNTVWDFKIVRPWNCKSRDLSSLFSLPPISARFPHERTGWKQLSLYLGSLQIQIWNRFLKSLAGFSSFQESLSSGRLTPLPASIPISASGLR